MPRTEDAQPALAGSSAGKKAVPPKQDTSSSFERMRAHAEKTGYEDYMESPSYQAWLHWG